jgi:hypothetical protein
MLVLARPPGRGGQSEAGNQVMPSDKGSTAPPDAGQTKAVKHVSGAHELLKKLREKLGEHPELGEAITELEMALSILTVRTAGLL